MKSYQLLILSVFIFLSGCDSPSGGSGEGSAHSQALGIEVDYHSESLSDFKTALEKAEPGDVISLPHGKSISDQTFKIPCAVTVVGCENTQIVSKSDFSLFDVRGISGVKFYGFDIELINGRGIYANNTRDLNIEFVDIEGNILGDDTCYTGIKVVNSYGTKVSNINISETYGGIYINNSDFTEVKNVNFDNVTFGNLVVSGDNFHLNNIYLQSPGIKPAKRPDPNGDGITLGLFKNGVIENVEVDDGGCYGLWSYTEGSRGLVIKNFRATNGITAGIHLQNVEDYEIDNAYTKNNNGPGIRLYPVKSGVVKNSRFVNDAVLIYSQSVDNKLLNNRFTLPKEKAVIYNIDFFDVVDGNTFSDKLIK